MDSSADELKLAAAGATAVVDLVHGGRLASLVVDGHELLVTAEPQHRKDDPFGWGAYPMVPWAGRVAAGRFVFDTVEHQLPINMGDHSLHGTAFTSHWRKSGPTTISMDLVEPWPFAGSISQDFELTDEHFRCRAIVRANETMPVMIGWHPWFVRHLGDQSATLTFGQAKMFERDATGIPTGRLGPVPPGPWDDCFTQLSEPPRVSWGDVMAIELSSSCDHWVIYDEQDHAVCVEPQTGPPNQFNSDPVVVEAGSTIEAWYGISWADRSH